VAAIDYHGNTLWTEPGLAFFSPVLTENSRFMLGSATRGLFALTTYGLGIAAMNFYQMIEGSREKLIMCSNAAINRNRAYTLAFYYSNATETYYTSLYAVDVRKDIVKRLNVSWHFDFNERPIGQPIYLFDLHTNQDYVIFTTDTTIYAILDNGFQFDIVWQVLLSKFFDSTYVDGVTFAQGSQEFWVYNRFESCTLFQLSINNGTVLNNLDLGEYAPNCVISSYVTVAGFQETAMLVAVQSGDDNNLLAIDDQNSALLWNFDLGDTAVVGQLPIMNVQNSSMVVFSTQNNGIWAVGQ